MLLPLKLISEAKSFEITPVSSLIENVKQEDGTIKKSHFIEGIYIQTNVKNRNGRNYPKKLMEQCVAKYIKDRMAEGTQFRSFGELGHPDGVEINLDKVCHYVQQLQWQGNDCIGRSKILTSTPTGRIVETLLDEKLRLGVSTRGLGALAKNASADGSKEVQAYDMIAVDIVADPSAPQGFVDGILENKDYIIQDGGVIVECFNNLEHMVEVLPKHSTAKEKVFLDALQKFLKEIRNR
jgi:hypothetical protein